MSLEAYRLFCTAVEVGNLTKAAELLNITPSAASHSIRALERALGVTLLIRNHTGISPTDYGKTLLPLFSTILRDEERIKEEVAQINHLLKGRVRIGVFESVCNQWFPTILRKFSEKYPLVQLQIYQEGYRAIEQMLMDSKIDIGFVALPTRELFHTTTIYQDPLLCITPPDFRPQNSAFVTAEDLRSENIIISRRGFDRTTESFLKSNHLATSTQHDVSLDSSAIALVESGFGVSILPELALKCSSQNCSVYPLHPMEYRTIAIASLKRQSRTPAAIKLVEEIKLHAESIVQSVEQD